MKHHILQGAGLVLRPALLAPLKSRAPDNLQFLELTPPDWMGVGGRISKDLKQLTQHYPSVCLSQSLFARDGRPLVRHLGASFEWPVHGIDTDHKLDDMQSTHVSMLRDPQDDLHVLESRVFCGQLTDLLREGVVLGTRA